MNLAGKNIKCIAFDLDHTVINSDGTMSDATRTVIEQAIAEGIEIVPVVRLRHFRKASVRSRAFHTR